MNSSKHIIICVIVFLKLWNNSYAREFMFYEERFQAENNSQSNDESLVTNNGKIDLTIRDAEGKITHCLIALERISDGEDLIFEQEFGLTLTGSNRPQWKDKSPFRSGGKFVGSVPPGDYRLTIGKGLEYEPVLKIITVRQNKTLKLSVKLKFFKNMASNGWWSGDDHVHCTRMLGIEPELLPVAQCDDIHFTNVLQMGLWFEKENPMDGDELEHWDKIALGKNRSKAHEGSFWLVQGQEHPRTPTLGHSLMLNIDKFIHHEDQYYLYDKVWQECRDNGAVTGYAHFFKKVDPRWGPVLGHVIQFAEGRVDFVEIADNVYLDDPGLYYEMLNMGFMIPATAGTDYPYGLEIGDNRTYVYIDPKNPVSPDTWTNGLKAGHTFITKGPLLDFRVNNEIIGSVIHIKKGQEVNISAIAFGHPMIGSPSKISLISMGKEIKSTVSNNIDRDTLVLNYTIKIQESLWFLIHVDAHNGGFALSSPIYVIVDHKRAIDKVSVEKLINDRLCKTEILKAGIRDIPGYQKEDFLQRIDNAEKYWKAMPDTLPDLNEIK